MSNPIRVLLLIDSFQMGGAERITAAILPHLDRSRVAPIVCTLRTRGDSPLAEHLGNVPRIDLGAKRMLDPHAFQRLLDTLRLQQIDLIHAQLQDSTVFAVLANKLTGIPVVVTRHVIGDEGSTQRKRLRNRVEQLAIKLGVSRIITVSNATLEHYSAITGLPRSRFQTIYNGIDLDNFGPAEDKIAARHTLGLPPMGPLVAMVGVMRPGKGQEVAIEAARRLPCAHFLIVGDGDSEYRAKLETQAQGLSHIHFLGQRMDVPKIMGASDILILPSDSEALPTVLIEAGASALPVIATRVGGIPEIVEDGVTGILIPTQDAPALANGIQHLLDRPMLATRMGERAYQRVHDQFTLSSQTKALADLYYSVTAEAQRAVS